MDTFDNGNYGDSDRRVEQRREIADRRQDIRFEPSKEDRRKSSGRRKSDVDLWRQHEE